jgi:hypothetical protein
MEQADKDYLVDQVMGSLYAFKEAANTSRVAVEKKKTHKEVLEGLLQFIDSEFDRIDKLYDKLSKK